MSPLPHFWRRKKEQLLENFVLTLYLLAFPRHLCSLGQWSMVYMLFGTDVLLTQLLASMGLWPFVLSWCLANSLVERGSCRLAAWTRRFLSAGCEETRAALSHGWQQRWASCHVAAGVRGWGRTVLKVLHCCYSWDVWFVWRKRWAELLGDGKQSLLLISSSASRWGRLNQALKLCDFFQCTVPRFVLYSLNNHCLKQWLWHNLCYSLGVLKVWEVATAACVYSQPVPFEPVESEEEASEHSLTHCMLVPERNEIVTVSVEHNIVFYDAQTLQLRKQVTTLSLSFPLLSVF